MPEQAVLFPEFHTHLIGHQAVDGFSTCRRAFKFDHLCALNFDQG